MGNVFFSYFIPAITHVAFYEKGLERSPCLLTLILFGHFPPPNLTSASFWNVSKTNRKPALRECRKNTNPSPHPK